MDNGPSMVDPEDFAESERDAARQYKRDTGRQMSFVVVPIDKYPTRPTVQQLEALLANQPEAINGILE